MLDSLRVVALLTMLLSAFGQPAAAHAEEDPLEPFNRTVHAFNTALHSTVVAPVAAQYEAWVPAGIRSGLTNALANLREPLTALSSSLQGDLGNAGTVLGRFAINTTVGLGGVFDPATELGWVGRNEDIGQVLCTYGVPEGAYVVIPLLGPATLRDVAGTVAVAATGVSLFGDDWLLGAAAGYTVTVLDSARAVQSLNAWAVDSYAQQRSAYLQLRRAACGNGQTAEVPADSMPTFEDFSDAPTADPQLAEADSPRSAGR